MQCCQANCFLAPDSGLCVSQELLKLNVAQGLQDTVNSQTFMGRCVIDIGKFSKTPNVPVDDWCAMASAPDVGLIMCS